MTTILLMRHGENEWVKEHRLAGWIEGVKLNENGHQQAAALADRVKHLPIKAIYSSPLIRCQQTADYVAKAVNLELIDFPEMGEVKYGEWEGEKIADLSKKPEWHAVQFFPSRFGFPNGETMRNVQMRSIDALEALRDKHPDEMIAVASHADVIKLVLAYYLGVHIDLFQRIGLSPASVSVLHLAKNGGMRVLRMNDDGPIEAPKPPEEKSDTDEEGEGEKDSEEEK